MATTKQLGSKPSDCFQFRDPDSWICMTELASDVVVEVGEMSFHLHKFPFINRSGTLQKLINESAAADGKPCTVRLVPDYARALDDGLYRAIDIYLKSHPWLTDSEREQLCRLMNCRKLSLEACTHAAQNERLPLRVVVQVLFFEQLRLRTTVAGWFFVSDNVDQGSPSAAHGYAPRKSGELDFAAGSEDDVADAIRNNEQASVMGVEEIRQRVVEFEEECSSMRQDIHRLGKPKGAFSRLFQKLGLGWSSSSRRQQEQQPSSSDDKRRSLDLSVKTARFTRVFQVVFEVVSVA